MWQTKLGTQPKMCSVERMVLGTHGHAQNGLSCDGMNLTDTRHTQNVTLGTDTEVQLTFSPQNPSSGVIKKNYA